MTFMCMTFTRKILNKRKFYFYVNCHLLVCSILGFCSNEKRDFGKKKLNECKWYFYVQCHLLVCSILFQTRKRDSGKKKPQMRLKATFSECFFL